MCFWTVIRIENKLSQSEIFCFDEAKDYKIQYIELFGCNPCAFPIRYLGIPIHYRRLSNKDWLKVQERFEKRISSWKGRNLCTGGCLTLNNSVLSSLPIYMMPFFEIPKGICKKLDYFRSRFFWKEWTQKEISASEMGYPVSTKRTKGTSGIKLRT